MAASPSAGGARRTTSARPSAPPSTDEPAVHALLRQTLIELFPDVADARFTHAWGGPLGIPRDWHSSVGFDRATGLAWAGGYVGDGVSTTNLAGRTLADLITGADTTLTHLPWVEHRLAALGARAPALARCQRRAVDDEAGRPQRGPARAAPAGWPGRMDRFLGAVIGATICRCRRPVRGDHQADLHLRRAH